MTNKILLSKKEIEEYKKTGKPVVLKFGKKTCKHCGSENIKKNGTRFLKKENVRISTFFCNDCKKTFSFDGRIPKEEKIEDAKELFLRGFTKNEISKIFKVAHITITRWFEGLIADEDIAKNAIAKRNLTPEKMEEILQEISPNTSRFNYELVD